MDAIAKFLNWIDGEVGWLADWIDPGYDLMYRIGCGSVYGILRIVGWFFICFGLLPVALVQTGYRMAKGWWVR